MKLRKSFLGEFEKTAYFDTTLKVSIKMFTHILTTMNQAMLFEYRSEIKVLLKH